jgi:hypothetical protein
VFLFLALGLALVGLTGLLVRQFKVEDSKISVEEARQDAMKLALAQQQNRLELDSLLRYFDLQAGAKEYELRKEYARRAKILHPDTGQRGVNQEFNELQSRYARARKLINER